MRNIVKQPKVSIIIPLYVIENRFFIDLKKYKKLNYSNYEILIVCDKKLKISDPKVKFIMTKQDRTGPAEKRDLGLKYAKGEICAFIDDDAYPDPNWLKFGVSGFADPEVVAVGGPGLTPKEDDYMQRLGGKVYESLFTSAGFRERFLQINSSNRKEFNDWPAFNLLVRTATLKQVKGYDSNFYGGEDTFLCLKLIKKGKIIYIPKAIVYHHRRALFVDHLKQIMNVGIHRGYFAKKFPETSRHPLYFLPSLAFLGFIVLFICSFISASVLIFLLCLSFLIIIMIYITLIMDNPYYSAVFVTLGILLTHISYGIGFIRGFLSKKLLR